MYKSLICILLVVTLSSCSYFTIRKATITQGNIITEEEVSQLHTGMSSAQVVSIMGNPVLTNILTPNRLVYVYTNQEGYRPMTIKRVSLVFSQDRLIEIHSS